MIPTPVAWPRARRWAVAHRLGASDGIAYGDAPEVWG